MFTSRNMGGASASLSFYERTMTRRERIISRVVAWLDGYADRMGEREWERHRRECRRQRESRA